MLRPLLIFLLSGFLLISCNRAEKQDDRDNTLEETDTKPVRLEREAPAFDAGMAYGYVKAQVDFGPRVPGTKGHRKCGDMIVSTLESHGGEVTEQTFNMELFNGKKVKGRNIFAAFYPEQEKRILLMAHWDTRPFADQGDEETRDQPITGANDAASGVGVLLEVARVLAENGAPEVGVDMLFFDVEDYGAPDYERDLSGRRTSYCLGSQHWGANKHDPSYQAYFGILLDMVGAKGAKFYWEGHSYRYASSVLKTVWAEAAMAGYADYFVAQKVEGLIDDHLFVNELAHIPTIDIIHHDRVNGDPFFEHWHKTTDDMTNIDDHTLKAVGQTLLQVIYTEPGF